MDIVNEKDEVIGKATEEEMYEKKLTHRIVHVFVFNDKGELALQLRSKCMSMCPNHWSPSASGHVRSGESYHEAALRESKEEIGKKLEMEFLFKDVYKKDNLKKILVTFKTVYNGPFKINPKEVEKIGFFSLNKIKKMIDAGKKFHPELLFLLRRHFGFK
ncbi:MAG: NUDIX domain-containing protein [Candidatus Aenigmatarchaeota archaeon]